MNYLKIIILLIFISGCATRPSNTGTDHAVSSYSGIFASNLGLESIALPIALIPLITNSIYRYNEIYNNPYDHEAEMEALYKSRINYDYIPTGGCRVFTEHTENSGTITYRKCKQPDGSWKKE